MDYPEFVAAVREMVREGDLARLMVPSQRVPVEESTESESAAIRHTLQILRSTSPSQAALRVADEIERELNEAQATIDGRVESP